MAGIIDVVGLSGAHINVQPPATRDDDVQALRHQVAIALGVPSQLRIMLLCGGREITDDDSLEEVTGEQGLAVITATVMPCGVKPSEYESYIVRYPTDEQSFSFRFRGMRKGYVSVGTVEFPAPTGIDINMMPFIIGDEASIPQEYQHYWPLIEQCCGLHNQQGQVGFLTIQESTVEEGVSQRRPGLHLETPGLIMRHGGETEVHILAHWGRGDTDAGDKLYGGIYMASNVSDSCAVWNAQVKSPELMCGTLGDVEHLRDYLGKGVPLSAGELVWITDTTPHESLPLRQGTLRQYFRVVTSAVSVWYERHSTKNRLGIVPDPRLTEIISDDKFATWGQEAAQNDREEYNMQGGDRRHVGVRFMQFTRSIQERAREAQEQEQPEEP